MISPACWMMFTWWLEGDKSLLLLVLVDSPAKGSDAESSSKASGLSLKTSRGFQCKFRFYVWRYMILTTHCLELWTNPTNIAQKKAFVGQWATLIIEVNGRVILLKNCSETKFEKIDHSTIFDLDDLEKATFIMGKFSFSPICAENTVLFCIIFIFCRKFQVV